MAERRRIIDPVPDEQTAFTVIFPLRNEASLYRAD